MSHPQLEQLFREWATAWPPGGERDSALAELRDHALSVYESELDSGASEEEALAAALAECEHADQWMRNFRGESYQRRVRWTMRLSTAAIVAGVLICGSIAIWWPGNTAPPLAVAPLQAQQPGAPPKAAEDVVPDTTETNNAATQKKLATYIAADFTQAPLNEVLGYIGEQTEIETYINAKVLEEAGVAIDAPVSIHLKRVRADMLLDLALQQVGAGAVDYIVRDGIVVVTTVESLDGASEVKAYPVTDLLRLHSGREHPAPAPAGGLGGVAPAATPMAPGLGGGGFGGAGYELDRIPESVEQLMNVISSTVAPDSWKESGGFGTITYYGDMLVVRQNARTHREVEKLLKLLRDTAAKK